MKYARRDRGALAQLVPQAELGKPVEREFLALPARHTLGIDVAGTATDGIEQRCAGGQPQLDRGAPENPR
jgi:hypothetical protein